MLADGISADQLEDLVVESLRCASTLAEGRVFSWADWPTSPDLFPILLVSAPRDRKNTAGMGFTQFNTTISLVVVGRVVAIHHQWASASIKQLRRQIEDAVMCNPKITQYVQRFLSVDTQIAITAEAKNHVGEIGMTFEIEVYQFFVYDGRDPLIDIQGTLQPAGDPGPAIPIIFDITEA